mmetsp:Transcript_23933/g.74187  ORF Transcript_23933/g.74187 Transcript_23933/m.74187 type:complete len:325 (+) Transcript_23933:1-975(+)
MAVAVAVAMAVAMAVALAPWPVLAPEEVRVQREGAVQGEGVDLQDLAKVHLALAAGHDLDRRAHRADPGADHVALRGVDEVALVEQADVGDGELLPDEAADLGPGGATGPGAVGLEGLEVPGVADADDAVQLVGGLDEGVREEGLGDGQHLGEAGALDEEAVELALRTGRAGRGRVLRGQPPQGLHEVAPHAAAEAAVRHDHHLSVAALHKHELVVHGDAAELVLHDADALAMAQALEHKVQKGSLPRAQEAREDRRAHPPLPQALTLFNLPLLRRREALGQLALCPFTEDAHCGPGFKDVPRLKKKFQPRLGPRGLWRGRCAA